MNEISIVLPIGTMIQINGIPVVMREPLRITTVVDALPVIYGPPRLMSVEGIDFYPNNKSAIPS